MSASVISNALRQVPRDLSPHLDQQASAVQGAAMRLPDMQSGTDSFDPTQIIDNTPEPDNSNPRGHNTPGGAAASQPVPPKLNNQQLLWLQAMYAPLASNLAREAMKVGKEELPHATLDVVKGEYDQREQEKRQNAYSPYNAYYNRVQAPLGYPTLFGPSTNVPLPVARQLSVYG